MEFYNPIDHKLARALSIEYAGNITVEDIANCMKLKSLIENYRWSVVLEKAELLFANTGFQYLEVLKTFKDQIESDRKEMIFKESIKPVMVDGIEYDILYDYDSPDSSVGYKASLIIHKVIFEGKDITNYIEKLGMDSIEDAICELEEKYVYDDAF